MGGRAGPAGSLPGDTAVARAERAVARAMLFFRLGGLVGILLAVGLDFGRYPHPALSAGLVALVAAESAVVVGACLRTGTVRAGWITADVAFCTAALACCAVLTAPRDYYSWANFIYPYSLLIALGAGAAFRRLTAAVAVTTLLAVGYLASAIAVHGEPVWNVLPNTLTYYANMIVSWAVARHLLAGGVETDRARAEAVCQAGELAKQREHARHARILHDRVLQTLETLATGAWVADDDFRAHIGSEAAWLRALVEGSDPDGDQDLLAGLQRLAGRNAHTGLRVELNCSQLQDRPLTREVLPPAVVDAVVDATQEALTNVAKHAGVDSAVVRAGTTAGALTVTVLDHGRGFDPAAVSRRRGIERSLCARIAEQGGCVRIDSAVGSGTYVEIVVPLSAGTD